MHDFPGFHHGFLVVDSRSGKALAVTFWDNEDQARRGPGTSIRDRVGRALGARETPTVETYDVGIETSVGTTGGRFARVSEYHGSAAKAEEGIRATEKGESDLKALQGFHHAYLLVDRKSGKAVTITLWDSEDALTRTSSGATSLREGIMRGLGASEKPIVETFEVAGRISRRARRAV